MGEPGVQAAPEDGDRCERGYASEDRKEQRGPLRMGVHHDDRIGSGRWMHGASCEHQTKRDGDRTGVGKQAGAQELETSDACQGAEKMTSEQSTRLSCGRSCQTEQKDSASPERSQNERHIWWADQEKSERDCTRGPEQAPDEPCERMTVHVPSNVRRDGRLAACRKASP